MRAYVGLGSNLGDRVGTLADALQRLDALDRIEVRAVSHVYESEPWGVSDQPHFANAVAVLDTTLSASDLLGAFKQAESELGREPGELNGPRAIDLDLLLLGDEEWDLPDLTLPHPRMLEREFVVTPLLDVDPHVRMPDGSRVTADGATQGHVIGMIGTVPGFEDRTWGEPSMSTGAAASRPMGADEEWVSVWQRPGYNPLYSMPAAEANAIGMARGAHIPGAVPNVEANFVQLVLEQLGIPYAWDPFAPERSSDPYGLSRPFELLVPASMAEEARAAIREAASAPIQWDDLPK